MCFLSIGYSYKASSLYKDHYIALHGAREYSDELVHCVCMCVQLMALKGEHIIAVACGSGDAHSLAAARGGNVFSWGDGDYGKLGRGGNEGSKVPKRVDSLTKKGVIKLMCGSQFSIALTDNGQIYTW